MRIGVKIGIGIDIGSSLIGTQIGHFIFFTSLSLFIVFILIFLYNNSISQEILSMTPEYENLINSLISDGYLKTPLLIEAFKNIDRQDFVPEEYKNSAYINEPLPIGFEQTISQPLTVAFLMELLEPKPGEKILDIGAGSGWSAALLAYVVGKENLQSEIRNPKIIGIERLSELKEFAEKNLAKYGFIDPIKNKTPQAPLETSANFYSDLTLRPDGKQKKSLTGQASGDAPSAGRISNGVEKGIAMIVCADGVKGYRKEAPYDKILAGAAAKGDVPAEWKKQLKIGGRIVAPVGNSIVVIDKTGKGKYSRKEHFGFSFVPLISDK